MGIWLLAIRRRDLVTPSRSRIYGVLLNHKDGRVKKETARTCDVQTEMPPENDPAPGDQSISRPLTPEAQRALAEAEARRKRGERRPELPQEVGGRDGPEPTRFGDWEKGGIASDF
jgi:hypothetical protein